MNFSNNKHKNKCIRDEFLRDLKHFYDDFSMVFGNELCVFHF
jgi:hypothetical protein